MSVYLIESGHTPEAHRQVHSAFFARLFPHAAKELKRKALTPLNTALFKRGVEALRPSVAFLNPEARFLITDERRFQSLIPQQRRNFVRVAALESRSHRARFLVTEEGQVVEFKGLTPQVFDSERRNLNSGQPEGLLEIGAAEEEVEGIRIIGDLETGERELDAYFSDLVGYAQVFRAAKAGERYFCWMRMDIELSTYELLAALEGTSLEKFLYKSGFRFGRQLRKMHKAGKTLHSPFGMGVAAQEPFFSTLHSGNVDPHGNIVDLEGLTTQDEAEISFWTQVGFKQEKKNAVPPKIFRAIERRSFDIFCRASDLQTFLGGRGRFPAGPSISARFLNKKNGSPDKFFYMLSGIVHGYFALRETAVKEEIDQDLKGLIEHAKRNKWSHFPFGQTLKILEALAF